MKGTANLTKQKKRVAELLVTPTELSVAEICIQNQMSVADLCKLFEDDTFTAYLHRLIEGYSRGAVGTVWDALIEKCRSGDMRAIKLYFDLKGGKTTDEGASVVITGADDLE